MSNNDSFMTVLFAVVLGVLVFVCLFFGVFFLRIGLTDSIFNNWNPISATL